MELAENVDGKTLSFVKSGKFDTRSDDSEYLVSEDQKSRLRGYICTFGCMICCGILLVGGGAVFIYASVTTLDKSASQKPSIPTGRMAPGALQDEQTAKGSGNAKEFQIVAFIFIAVGAVLFMVGVPFASRFYRRYSRTKESETSPILERTTKEKGGRIYKRRESKTNKSGKPKKISSDNPPETDETTSRAEAVSTGDKITFLNKKRNSGKRRKSKTGWMYRSPQRISNESFRFAAHRHPSMNHIQFDGSKIFGSFESAESSSGTSSDEDFQDASPRKKSDLSSSNHNGFQGFVSKIFRRRDDQDKKLVENDLVESRNSGDRELPTNRQLRHVENDRRYSEHSVYQETLQQTLETGREINKNSTAVGQGGLYNLG